MISALYIDHWPPCSVKIGISHWKPHTGGPLFLSAFLLFEVVQHFLQISSLYNASSPQRTALSLSSHIGTLMHFCFHLSLTVCLLHTLPVSLFSFTSFWQVVLRGPSQLAVGYISHKSLSIWVKSKNNRPLRRSETEDTHTHTHKMQTQSWFEIVCVSTHEFFMCLYMWMHVYIMTCVFKCWFCVIGCTVCLHVLCICGSTCALCCNKT